jgi:hypothetical protein
MRQSNALRAAVSLGVGLFITFSQLHNATIGLLALAIFSLGFAITNSLGSIVWGKGLVAIEAMPLTVVSLLVGVFALMAMSGESAQTAFELYLARRASIKSTEGREFLMSAILSATLGLLFLVAPLDIVSAVGFFGAYLIVSGVQLGVAAATPSSSK